ncbi:MAG TPA: TIGR00159 family protein, partial [Bacteroidales bacterium]|nr:TIGR00159 family protein [Bacteroidales bacterium]
MLFNIIHFGIADVIDILLVSIIIYQLYKLLKGTAAIRILW